MRDNGASHGVRGAPHWRTLSMRQSLSLATKVKKSEGTKKAATSGNEICPALAGCQITNAADINVQGS